MAPSLRPLAEPRRVAVFASPEGVPRHVGGHLVEAVRDEWRIDDAWWTGARVRRRYFEVVLDNGALVTVFCDGAGEWWSHR
jgi:hypothetical protein